MLIRSEQEVEALVESADSLEVYYTQSTKDSESIQTIIVYKFIFSDGSNIIHRRVKNDTDYELITESEKLSQRMDRMVYLGKDVTMYVNDIKGREYTVRR